MIKETKVGTRREGYISPESEIISFKKEGNVIMYSGENAGDEGTPGY